MALPDEERSLAPERTMLSWTRTALAVAATGAFGLRLPSLAARILGLLLIAAGALIWAGGYARFRRIEASMATGDRVASPAVMKLIAAAAVAAGFAALLYEIWAL